MITFHLETFLRMVSGHRLDRSSMGWGILLFVREGYPIKFTFNRNETN